jgi:two-component system heavy metal sensor histidine kinase CusS
MPNKSHRPVSLTLRVTALIGVATTLVLLAFGWMIERSIERHFAEQDADELQVVADAVRQALVSFSESPQTTLTDTLAKAVSGHHGIFFYVADDAGNTLYTSDGPNLAAIAQHVSATPRIEIKTMHVWQEPPNTYRGSVLKMKVDRDYTVAVATAMNFHLHFLQQFRHSLWLTTFAACVMSILAAWLAVHQGHAPLREISNRIRSIHSDQLHQRLPLQQVPHELLILAKAFNAMLDSIEDSFQRLSNFSADIAHELRTPVTNLTTQTQVALSKARSTEEYREILYSNLEEFERMSKMISDMLFLAQTDNKLLQLELSKVDIAAEIQALFEYFEAWAEERGVELKWQGDTPVVQGDRLMLRRALSNLFSNAIRHTPQGQAVTVTLKAESSRVLIQVTNPGIEIPNEHLSRLFDRFYRVDPSRQHKGDGAGLGLAIVKSIVDAHAGTITVTTENSSITFQMTLPAKAD